MWVAVRSGDQVFKRTSPNGTDFSTQLFDLASDPEERRDLFDPMDPEHKQMEERLRNYKEELVLAYFRHHPAQDKDLKNEEQLEALRSLGYIQ